MEKDQLQKIEKRLDELRKNDDALFSQIQILQQELDTLLKQKRIDEAAHSKDTKVKYLTEVNEEMFQQIVRLRHFIEHCIDTQSVPTQGHYYEALRGDN